MADMGIAGSKAEQAAAQAPRSRRRHVQSNDFFPFFSLPRELRDHIYDRALTPNSTFLLAGYKNAAEAQAGERADPLTLLSSMDDPTRSPHHHLRPALHTGVKFRSDTNLLLANKAVKKEYEDRSRLAMTLTLKDNEHYAFQPITLPDQVKAVHWAEIHIILFCHDCLFMPNFLDKSCQAACEILRHRPWIEHLLSQLSQLRAFSIAAYLCYDSWKPDSKAKVPCEALVERTIQTLYTLPKLQLLTLCKYEFNAQPDLEGPKTMMLKWTPDEGEAKIEQQPSSDVAGQDDEEEEQEEDDEMSE